MSDGIGQQLKKVGSRFAFEFFLEVWQPRLVEMLRKWLSPVTIEDLKKMVRRGKFPDTLGLNFNAVQPYLEYLEKISTERLFEEYLAPARPDLAQAVQELGMPGAQWLVKLRQHLLDQVRGATKPVKKDLVQATCDNCRKSWPVPRDEFKDIKECPFCGHKQGEEIPSGPEPTPETEEIAESPRAVVDIEEELDHNSQ
jgi:hypothetical protein